jgi:hypothetical protein
MIECFIAVVKMDQFTGKERFLPLSAEKFNRIGVARILMLKTSV